MHMQQSPQLEKKVTQGEEHTCNFGSLKIYSALNWYWWDLIRQKAPKFQSHYLQLYSVQSGPLAALSDTFSAFFIEKLQTPEPKLLFFYANYQL